MNRLVMITAAALALLTIGAKASYTECSAVKEISLVSRPGGETEPRWSPVEKGDKVAIRKAYRAWVFVLHFIENKDEYGWVQRSALVNCQA